MGKNAGVGVTLPWQPPERIGFSEKFGDNNSDMTSILDGTNYSTISELGGKCGCLGKVTLYPLK